MFGNFRGSKFRDNSMSFYSGLQLELFSFSGFSVILGSAFTTSQGQFPSEQTAGIPRLGDESEKALDLISVLDMDHSLGSGFCMNEAPGSWLKIGQRV